MKNYKGMTMIELMVVVAIIGIISMFAFPSYQNSQRKARISEGIAKLTEAQSQIEKYRLTQRKKYDVIVSDGLAKIGINPTVNYSSKPIYTITLTLATEKNKDDKDIYDSNNKYILKASAKGHGWIDNNTESCELIMNGFGILKQEKCK